jgi:hypothetical protein
MIMEDKIRFIQTVFTAVVNQNKERLRNGSVRRGGIIRQMNDGSTVSNYRTKFIRETAKKLIETMKVESIRFNSQNNDDQASVDDLNDILATASGILNGTL